MALKHGEDFYTMFTHVENGQVLNRRLHRIEMQGRDGRLYVLEGRQLPDFIQTNTGTGSKGAHVAQILLKPGDAAAESGGWLADTLPRWLTFRDLSSGFFGIVFYLIFRLVVMIMQGRY